MWADLIGDAIDAVVKYGFQFFAGQMDKRNLVAQGQATQAATETATSAKISASEANAEAQTDRTATGLENAASKSQF